LEIIFINAAFDKKLGVLKGNKKKFEDCAA
jgi:hypothetical protein